MTMINSIVINASAEAAGVVAVPAGTWEARVLGDAGYTLLALSKDELDDSESATSAVLIDTVSWTRVLQNTSFDDVDVHWLAGAGAVHWSLRRVQAALTHDVLPPRVVDAPAPRNAEAMDQRIEQCIWDEPGMTSGNVQRVVRGNQQTVIDRLRSLEREGRVRHEVAVAPGSPKHWYPGPNHTLVGG